MKTRGETLLKELEILLDWQSPSAQFAAGNKLQTAAVSQPINPGGANGSLANDEVAEICALEFWPPMDSLGNEQFLSDVYYIADAGTDSQSFFKLSGRSDLCLFPPRAQVVGGPRLVWLGGGLIGAKAILNAGPLPGETQGQMMHRALMELAVPRYNQQFIFAFLNGPNAIAATCPFRIRAYGYRYKVADIDSIFSNLAFGGRIQVNRPWNGQSFTFQVPMIGVSADNWTKLPGGKKATVQPFTRWGIASQASSPGQEYSMSFTGSNGSFVSPNDENQNLDFDFTKSKEDDVLVIDGFCVRALNVSADAAQTDLVQAGVNLAYQYLKIPNDQPHAYHPNNALPAAQNDNPQLAGQTYPNYGTKENPTYDLIKPLAGQSVVIARNRAFVAFRDSGVSIPANNVGAVLTGLLYQGVSDLVQS